MIRTYGRLKLVLFFIITELKSKTQAVITKYIIKNT